MFKKILIANRGEVALRIQRTCREMGIQTVMVYSQADRDAKYVRLADESVCIGPAHVGQSYLSIPALIAAAEVTNVQAIHPGYGFLSENAAFAAAVQESGFCFIGPHPKTIELMGSKVKAKQFMQSQGFDVLSGSCVLSSDERLVLQQAQEIGYPVLVKASNGGGGRAMGVAYGRDELMEVIQTVRSQARCLFHDDQLYLEAFLEKPRHIEIQIVGDGLGRVISLGSRDCSVQRKRQKVIEQAPAVVENPEALKDLEKRCVEVGKFLLYKGLGTFEFLYENGVFYFIEMNTRLQVEHTVTEQLTGLDLVRLQIEIAAQKPLTLSQQDVVQKGFAIECRVNAEKALTFEPSCGVVSNWHNPGGPWVRVDSHVYSGYTISPYYDSLIAKVISWGSTRAQCIDRMGVALSELVVDGVDTNLELLRQVIQWPVFAQNEMNVYDLERYCRESKNERMGG